MWDELQQVPVGFLQQIIEYRRYAAAYFANQSDPHGWQASVLRTLAKDIEFELAAEEIATRPHG